MTTLALNSLVASAWRRGNSLGSRMARIARDLLDGVREGQHLLSRYEDLSSRSDSELARLGLAREDIPRAVALGGRRSNR